MVTLLVGFIHITILSEKLSSSIDRKFCEIIVYGLQKFRGL